MAARARSSGAIGTAQLAPLHRPRWLAIQRAPAIQPPRCARSGKSRASLLRRQCLQSKPSACVANPTAAKVACQHCLLSRPKVCIAERSRAKRQGFACNFSAPQRAAAEAICSRADSQPLQLRPQLWRPFHCGSAQRGCSGNSNPHCSQRMLRADCSAALKSTPKQLRRQRFHRDGAEDPLPARGLRDSAHTKLKTIARASLPAVQHIPRAHPEAAQHPYLAQA